MSFDSFDKLIDIIYAAGAEPERWTEALETITKMVSGCGAALHINSSDCSSFNFCADYNIDPEAQKDYVEHFHKINPVAAPLSRLAAGAVVSSASLIPQREVVKTEFYNDYGGRYDLGGSATVILAKDHTQLACLGVLHSMRGAPFGEQQMALLARAAPHLQRALNLTRRLTSVYGELTGKDAILNQLEFGVILLDEKCDVIYTNAAAEALAVKGDGVAIRNKKLYATQPQTEKILRRLIFDAVSATGERGGFITAIRESGSRPLSIRVAPLPRDHNLFRYPAAPRAIVFVTDPQRAPGDWAQSALAAYGLTGAEKRLVTALVTGDSVKEAAGTVGVTQTTARNLLARAMTKTDTHRQTELVRLVLSSRAPVR